MLHDFEIKRTISHQEVRFYLMYWDKSVIPGDNLVHISIPDEAELLRCSAIQRPRIEFQGAFHGNEVANAILSCQSIAAGQLVQDEAIDSVILQFGDALNLPPKFLTLNNTIRVDLVNALPVPSSDTAIDELLEFKLKRNDQLAELHDSIDELYLEIFGSPDHSFSTNKAVLRLKDSLSAIDKLQTERFKKLSWFDLSVELSSGKISAGAMIGAAVHYFDHPVNLLLGLCAGAITSTIRIKSKATMTFTPGASNSKLAYLTYAKRARIL